VPIRAEEEKDWTAVQAVNESAFETSAEARLVARLREEAQPVVSLVAASDGENAGHIMFSPVSLSGHAHLKVMGLGPMAVLPRLQRKGSARRWRAPASNKPRSSDSARSSWWAILSFTTGPDSDPRRAFTSPVNSRCRRKRSCPSSSSPAFWLTSAARSNTIPLLVNYKSVSASRAVATALCRRSCLRLDIARRLQ